jgi:hypothetical protein
MGKSAALDGAWRDCTGTVYDRDQNMLTMMLNGCDAISEEETRRFQTRESIGTCPVCGSLVYESKTNFYCSNHDCHFALWKDNRYLQSMEKTMDKKMAAELLKKWKCACKRPVFQKEEYVL